MERYPQGKERAYHLKKGVLVKRIHKLLQIPFYLNTVTMLFQNPSSSTHQLKRRPMEGPGRVPRSFSAHLASAGDAATT
ncbi:hypothetical protein O0I10_010025 [Lichtheimia ornata]|uniref:Uncharacterized protein n=1 Tax=Lichtheimia ornata TaxID=688661 RepID=A0AAD7UWX2_9FUNG|nr:uncharacterized protein O0I10_010025 [Lichtheimia ornata]KAJ8654329.1 hypothetical protein O0I10_010025 [Lichtheimia ornata]